MIQTSSRRGKRRMVLNSCRGKRCNSGECSICNQELSCEEYRYENFHSHGVTLCQECVRKLWVDFQGVCFYCNAKLWASCAVCHSIFPMSELIHNWHGHQGHNLCLICLQTQYARSKYFECTLHTGESVIIPYRSHPMIGEARFRSIFRHVNTISQLTTQLIALLSNYGYPHTAQRVSMDLSWFVMLRNVVLDFGR